MNMPKTENTIPFKLSENYKILMKQIKYLKKWKNILCSWIERINIIKMLIFHKLIYTYNEIFIKFSARIFVVTSLCQNLYRMG